MKWNLKSNSGALQWPPLFLALAALAFPLRISALTNGLALTPPMGFNPWYQCTWQCGEWYVKACADTIATNGMKAAGYEFINLDDCWFAGRGSDGKLIVDAIKFPSGVTSLANYVHSKGLKFGIYLPAINNGSACVPIAMTGHELTDAATILSYGVDFLKYDYVYNNSAGATMWNAIQAAGGNIVFSLGSGFFEPWMPAAGNLWRTSADYYRSDWTNVMRVLDDNNRSAAFAGPGHWNDPDILHIGPVIFGGTMTDNEYRSHFSMWCMMAAPLIVGADVTTMSADFASMLAAPELIAIDQDPAGVQGYRISSTNSLEVWNKPLGTTGTTKAVALLNRSDSAATISVDWPSLSLPPGPALVRDLWARRDLGTFTGSFATNVLSHQAVILKISTLPPSLQLAQAANQVILSWPLSASNYLLETCPRCTLSGWTPLSSGIVTSASNFFLTNNLEAPAAFYRLRRSTD